MIQLESGFPKLTKTKEFSTWMDSTGDFFSPQEQICVILPELVCLCYRVKIARDTPFFFLARLSSTSISSLAWLCQIRTDNKI